MRTTLVLLVNALEMRYPSIKMKVGSLIVRHAGWLLAAYERLHGREFKGQVVEPFEVVHYKLWEFGFANP